MKTLTIVLAIFLLLFSYRASSQTDQKYLPPIMKEKYRQGIYRDFNEFVNNRPTIGSPFQVHTKATEARILRGEAEYRLLLLDSATSKKDMKKIWGFSDGNSVYVNELN